MDLVRRQVFLRSFDRLHECCRVLQVMKTPQEGQHYSASSSRLGLEILRLLSDLAVVVVQEWHFDVVVHVLAS